MERASWQVNTVIVVFIFSVYLVYNVFYFTNVAISFVHFFLL